MRTEQEIRDEIARMPAVIKVCEETNENQLASVHRSRLWALKWVLGEEE